MPELFLGKQQLHAEQDENLLDCLLRQGQRIPWSCRAGQCQSCLIQARPGEAPESATRQLQPEQQQQGWLLACQCAVQGDMHLHLHDPARDGLPAQITRMDFVEDILILRLQPTKALRFKPGQHLLLWLDGGLGRPYSIASQPAEQDISFHLRLHPQGAFSQRIRECRVGDTLHLGAPSGHLHYDPLWHDTPLLLLASGTGLAPLQAIAREALESGHNAPIALWHWSRTGQACYLEQPLQELAAQHPLLQLNLLQGNDPAPDLKALRLASRKTMALLCGHPAFVEQLRKPLFMAGLSGRQILDEAFISRPH
ncbi:MAG: 2Fe-2S iron-sulfur cluster-binding protein [Pseudomonas sp.]